jgi:SAM-dependent methyltransferase
MSYFNSKKELSFGNYGWRGNINDLVFGLDEQQIKFFKNIIEKHDINTVLDVFCGSGELAVLLARWGKGVTVLAPEPLMKKEISLKGVQAGVRIDVCLGDMRDISSIYRKRCDLIVCLKNSLSRLLSEEDIWGTLAQMYLKLEPGGMLVIHTLNYDRLSDGDAYLIPVLDGQCQGLKIELLFKRGKGGGNASLIFKVYPDDVISGQGEELIFPVRPVLKKELNLWLAELGFERIENYDWYDWKTYTSNGYHRITVAYRPGVTAV